MNKSDYIINILDMLYKTNFFSSYPHAASIAEEEAIKELCDAQIMKYLGGPVDGSRKVYELLWDGRPITLAASQDRKNYGRIYKEENL